MLPRTATPSAPPSSRVVSFHAEPTPAFLSGSEVIIEAVAGAMVEAIPVAVMTRKNARKMEGVSTSTREVKANPSPTITNPVDMTRLRPNLSTIRAERGAATIIVTAMGNVARPAVNGE